MFDLTPEEIVRMAPDDARRFARARFRDPDTFVWLLEEIYADPTLTREDELELSGDPSAVRTLLGAVDVGGVLVLVGSVTPGPELSIAPEQLVRSLLTIRGVHNYAPRHLEQAVRFLAEAWQRYPFAEQVGATYPLADIDRALVPGAHPRVAVRP